MRIPSLFGYFLMLPAVMLVAACSRDYRFTRAVYEGVQTQNQLQTPPAERAGQPEPLNYQQYEAERKRPQ